MLFTVHTSFKAMNDCTGLIQGFSSKDKIEAVDKDAAKYIAWKNILDSGEYKFLTLESQSARVTKVSK